MQVQPEALPPPPSPPRTRRTVRSVAVFGGVFAAGLVLGVVLASLNVAGAQSSSPSPSGRTGTFPGHFGRPDHGPFGGEGFGPGGFGPGALHGEFTTPAPGGGYQTLAVQSGTVTSVDAASVAVRSADGFTRTYTVDDNTLVIAGNNGIADVKNGDEVWITAVVSGGKATAIHVLDATNVRRLRGLLHPPLPRLPAEPSPTA
jgi:hypothetical protein